MKSLGVAAAALVLIAAVGGCERHRSAAVGAAPEHLHAALGGDPVAQGALARCYDRAGVCLGVSPDPAMACAWRGVRLGSRSPGLSLADAEAFSAACALPQESQRQRAAIALADFSARTWGEERAALAAMAPEASERVLYPSIETVRTRVNFALARGRERDRLPAFAAPKAEAGALGWSTCAPGLCLTGSSPAFGGGVLWYRVSVRGADADSAARAGRLAAAGLEAPSAATALAGDGAPRAVGPVCWTHGVEAAGAYAMAAKAPCGRP